MKEMGYSDMLLGPIPCPFRFLLPGCHKLSHLCYSCIAGLASVPQSNGDTQQKNNTSETNRYPMLWRCHLEKFMKLTNDSEFTLEKCIGDIDGYPLIYALPFSLWKGFCTELLGDVSIVSASLIARCHHRSKRASDIFEKLMCASTK